MIFISIQPKVEEGDGQSRIAALRQAQIVQALVERGCKRFCIQVRESVVKAETFYVSIEHLELRKRVEISGDDMDALMSSLPVRVNTLQLLEAAMQKDSAVCV